MLIFSPQWISHASDKKRNTPIYSLHIHPSGEKLATGALDCKVKIWNMAPILSEDAEADDAVPKLLSTLSLHSGAVLCVRWSHGNGRYLASSSDDRRVVIWEKDENGDAGNLFGSTNVETWRPIRVLFGHESDVSDLAWSPDNGYLASCGFDGAVIIWDGSTFEKVKKIDAHGAFVKGVTWDPVGKFLATQADDKTLKVWRTSDWGLEKTLEAPYTTAPNNTFFRRLSWSPEGSCILSVNGENGAVPVAPIISRDGWSFDMSLVGHQAPIESAAFNPILFEMTQENSGSEEKSLSAVCAIGSQDNGISIWWTASARSAACATNVFSHSVLDMSWAPTGTTLMACSYDGSVVAMSFEADEFGTPVAEDEKSKILSKFGYKRQNNGVIETPGQLLLEQQNAAKDKETQPKTTSPLKASLPKSPERPTAAKPLGGNTSSNAPQPPAPVRQTESRTKDGKKRITPMFVRSIAGSTPAQPLQTTSGASLHTASQAMDKRMPDGGIPSSLQASKKRSAAEVVDTSDDGRQKEKKEPVQYVLPTVLTSAKTPFFLAIPDVQKSLSLFVKSSGQLESNDMTITCKNSDAEGTAQLVCTSKETQVWADKLYKPVIHLDGTPHFVVAGCVDGTLVIYSPAGRRMFPALVLDATPAFLDCCGQYMLCISSLGHMGVWDVVKGTCIVAREPLGHLLNMHGDTTVTIANASMRPEGLPLVTLSNGFSYAFDLSMKAFLQLSDPMEPLGDGRGILSSIQATAVSKRANGPAIPRTSTLSHIENQMACAVSLRSQSEYVHWIKHYARRLADEQAVSKVVELCDSLSTPSSSEGTQAEILGLSKRDLLHDLLPILGPHTS